MNCKPGDLAVVVSAPFDPHYLGRIVTCVSFFFVEGMPTWRTDPPMYWTCDSGVVRELPWCDKDLRPIRDQPGEDESLTWAPVPGNLISA
jgi:hypothetical protein